MDCKYCTKYHGVCGCHYIDLDGHIHYDLPSQGYVEVWDGETIFTCYKESRNLKQMCIHAVKESSLCEPYKDIILEILHEYKEDIFYEKFYERDEDNK